MASSISTLERKVYPARKSCTCCGRRRPTKPVSLERRRAGKFRLLSSGYLQGMCVDCEREYERERWHTRSAASKASSGSAAVRRRREREQQAA